MEFAIALLLAFYWLGYETDWLRVRLPRRNYKEAR